MIEDFEYTTEAIRIKVKDSFELNCIVFHIFAVIENGKMIEEIGTCFSIN